MVKMVTFMLCIFYHNFKRNLCCQQGAVTSRSCICWIETCSKQMHRLALVLDEVDHDFKTTFRPLVLNLKDIGGLFSELCVSTSVCSMGFYQEARPWPSETPWPSLLASLIPCRSSVASGGQHSGKFSTWPLPPLLSK